MRNWKFFAAGRGSVRYRMVTDRRYGQRRKSRLAWIYMSVVG